MGEYILELRNITKRFGPVTALDNVTVRIKKGEVHALLGENGAGKSTLMNCLYGMFDSYEGEIYLKDEQVQIRSSKEAIDKGIGMVHQHFMLIPVFTVIENVILGMSENKSVLDLNAAAEQFTQLAARYHMDIDPWARVEQLSVGQQQRLEILKALYRKADILILDEPTAVLTPEEIEGLFDVIDTLRGEGKTVIFISHKLNEIMHICDRCSVLRNGSCVSEGIAIADISDKRELATLMVGRDVELEVKKKPAQRGEARLVVECLSCKNERGQKAVDDMSFTVYGGEIFGICGVDGNGQSELIQCITGLRNITEGSVNIMGKDLTNKGARKVLSSGVGHIPEDRHRFGLVTPMSLSENGILVSYNKKNYSSSGYLKWGWINEHVNEILKKNNVKAPSIREKATNLSGGNQQKLVVGRELDRDPEVLIAVHPSRGLDIGATKFIQSEMVGQRDRGSAVLLVSTEMDEILELADRILVIYEGRCMQILDQSEATRERLGSLMAGVSEDNVPAV